VKLLDANVLLYAYDGEAAHHAACRAWLERAFNSDEPIALPWQTLLAFVRISTNPRAVRNPLPTSAACALVDEWLARPQTVVVEPGEQFWSHFRKIVDTAQISGPLVTDAALAALAIEQGAELCSTDRDFRRFDGLKLVDPSISS
jgi:uncharacterized protein